MSHQHGHENVAELTAGRRVRLRIVVLLNICIIVAQVVGGLWAHSLGLLADAGHNMTDAAAVFLSLLAVGWSQALPTDRRTYGLQRTAILAALANAATILAVTIVIMYEGIQRVLDPAPVEGGIVVAVALVAFVANSIAALLLREKEHDLNMRSALLHMAGDALASLGVAAAGMIILLTGRFTWLDPAVAMGIGVLIAWQAWLLANEAVHVLLEGVPNQISMTQVREHILGVEGVVDLHDLHVWSLTSGMNVMSTHVVIREGALAGVVLDELCECLGDHFDIEHSTFQIEHEDRSEREHARH